MKSPQSSVIKLPSLLLGLAIAGLAMPFSQAADFSYDGGGTSDNIWEDPDNYVGDVGPVHPASSDTIVFDNNFAGGALVSNEADTGSPDLGSFRVTDPGGPVSIEVQDSTIDLFGISGTLIDMSAATQDLTFIGDGNGSQASIRLFGSGAINVASGRTLTFGTDMRLVNSSGTDTYTFTGGGNIVFDGPNSGSGGIFNAVLDGATLAINAASAFSSGSTISVNSGSTLALGDTAGLGSATPLLLGGTLDVSGAAGYSTPAGGQVIGDGLIVGDYIHDEGVLKPSDTSSASPVAGPITFNDNLAFSGGTIAYDMNATPGGDDLIQVIGTTNVSGGGIVDPNFLGATPAAGLTYTILSGAGGFDVGNGVVPSWTVNWPGRGTKPSVFVDGFDLKFTTTAVGSVGNVVWTGASGSTWDVETTQNWSLGGSPDTFFQGDNVTFDDTGANPAISVSVEVNPGNMVVDANSNNYSFTGNSINATGSLTKRGSSTLTFDSSNEFTSVTLEGGSIDTSETAGTLGTGQLTLVGGSVVNIGGGAALANSSVEVSSGTVNTLSYVGVSGAGNSGTRPALGTLTGSGEVAIEIRTDGSYLDLNDTTGFSGTISIGPDGLDATSLGVVRLAGENSTFAGAEVNLSSLTVANRQGSSAESFTFTFGELNGDSNTTLNAFTGGSSDRPDAIWQIGDLNTDSAFAGAIVDDDPTTPTALSHVVKVGTGTLTLSGANTYTGDTTVEDGTLSITSDFLSDTGNVLIDGDALLDLNFSGTDDVLALYLDGTPVAAGLYGAANSGGLISGLGMLNVLTMGPPIGTPGDFDGNSDLDGADFLLWQTNPGVGNLADWEANYGASSGISSVSSVPEPGALVLCLLGGLFPVRRRFR